VIERDEPDPTDLAAQEQTKAEDQRRRRLQSSEVEEEIRDRMRSKLSRRSVWRDLDDAGVFRSVFNANAIQMGFAEGNRNAGLRILSRIHEHCPELYQVMVKENTKVSANDGHDSSTK
jgi:hypothetical protein